MMARHLVIMAAGTGGHVIPGLAVAREMLRRGWTVSWLGTTHGMENRLVPPSGIPMDTVRFSGLRGKGMVHTLTGGIRLLAAFGSCLSILRRRRAQAVLGMGGYVCFPGGVMASLLNKPLMLVNADAALLMSNKALLPVADRVAFGFEGEATKKIRQAVVTGNPVRAEIESLPAPAERYAGRTGPLRMLVVGGSLGAKALNDCVPQALALMPISEVSGYVATVSLICTLVILNIFPVMGSIAQERAHAWIRKSVSDDGGVSAAHHLGFEEHALQGDLGNRRQPITKLQLRVPLPRRVTTPRAPGRALDA